jgi:hypothetical protein
MRVSESLLVKAIDHLNKVTNNPIDTYKTENGKLCAQIGNYHLWAGNGSYSLYQIATEGGGVRDILWGKTKSELYGKLEAFLKGFRVGEKKAPALV